MPTILIASSSLDEATCQPVAEYVRQQGYDVVVYEADQVAEGRQPLVMRIRADGELEWDYAGRTFSVATVAAAWYRRPSLFGPLQPDAARQYSLDHERRLIQDNLWSVVADAKWLNSPGAIDKAGRKLWQLAVAKKLGFTTPDTVVTNDWPAIKRMKAEFIAFKAPYGFLRSADGDQAVYATVLKNDASLSETTVPFPGIWQAYILKKHEWRVTVVGDTVFSAIVDTKPTAKDDWRKHQESDTVTFRQAPFPAKFQRLCRAYLQYCNLRFGAFDFIETPAGELVFLELNPNGQYGWLEAELGFPISRTIGDELITIARQ